MKIAIMVLLIVTIAALSHFALAQRRYARWRQGLPTDGTTNFPWLVVKGVRAMWISIFAIAIVAAICFGVASLWAQPIEAA